MELTVLERIALLGVLPAEGNFTTLRIVRQLREALSFTEEDHKKYKFKQNHEAGTVVWDTREDTPVEIQIGEKATDMIVDALKKINDANKLTDQHFSLYEKFVEGGKNG